VRELEGKESAAQWATSRRSSSDSDAALGGAESVGIGRGWAGPPDREEPRRTQEWSAWKFLEKLEEWRCLEGGCQAEPLRCGPWVDL